MSLRTVALAVAGCGLLLVGCAAHSGGRGSSSVSGAQGPCPWLNTQYSVSRRVQLLMAAMTLNEKIAEMTAFNTTKTGPYAGYEGYVPAQPALCIPPLTEQDDSAGVGAGATGVTQLPAPEAAASTWDPALLNAYGTVIGSEERAKGIDFALAPTVNIVRNVLWGRAFETLGEDPYLTAQLDVADIQGIQSQHVIVDVKHFDAYNQETYRNTPADDVIVSTRVLHEIYMPAFEAAIRTGQAGSVMCAYSTVNGAYSCQNPYLLTDVLDGRWGFTGFVRSDGGANHSVVGSVNAGLDQEKGSDYFQNGQLAAAVQAGEVSLSTVNTAVSRILGEMFRFNLFNKPPVLNLHGVVTNSAHAAVALQVEEDGTVLLKNSGGILPLSSKVSSIAVIGPDGGSQPFTSGGGSAHVVAPYVITPYQGIASRAGSAVTVTYAVGTPTNPAALAAAVQAAKAAQVAIVFVNDVETEGKDRTSLTLPNDQNALIEAVAQANPNTIVVLNTGAPVTMPWLSQVKGLLEAWYAGQEDGKAIAAVLFGDVNPGGKLPLTFPVSLSQSPTDTPAQFPGVNGQVQYSEGLDVGYRWYEVHHVQPLFPFGFGLSYTTFSFSGLKVEQPQVALAGPVGADRPAAASGAAECCLEHVVATVTNTGQRAGAEVAQLYLGDPARTGEPPRQLKGFQRVVLQPGQSQQVTFTLSARDLAYWNTPANGFVVAPGMYQLYVGDASATADLPLRGSFQVLRSTGPQSIVVSVPQSVTAPVSQRVTATFTNGSGVTDAKVALHLSLGTGGMAAPAAGAASALSFRPVCGGRQGPGGGTCPTVAQLAPGGSLTATWVVQFPADTARGSYQFNVTAGYQTPAGPQQTENSATTTLPYATLASAFNNVGITTSATVGKGNFDGSGNSYSASLLQGAGLGPGASVTVGGVHFTWPATAPGAPDNISTLGQVVAFSGQGNTLGFLGAAVYGTQPGTGTVLYSDGTTQSFSISFGDWFGSSAPGDQVVATLSDLHRSVAGKAGHSVQVYFTSIPLQAGKRVVAVTLPNNSELHIFAMAIG